MRIHAFHIRLSSISFFEQFSSLSFLSALVVLASASSRVLAQSPSDKLERVKQAAKKGAASQSSLDERRHAYETARTRIAAIESQLRDRLIKAPFSGTVGLRNISVGALIEPGDIVTTLDDNSVMKLDFTVPATFPGTLT